MEQNAIIAESLEDFQNMYPHDDEALLKMLFVLKRQQVRKRAKGRVK